MAAETSLAGHWADNPYALAEAALGAAVDWGSVSGTRELQPLLQSAYGVSNIDALFRDATAADPLPTPLHLFHRVRLPDAGCDSVEQACSRVQAQYPGAYEALLARLRAVPGAAERLWSLARWLATFKEDEAPGDESLGAIAGNAPPPGKIRWQLPAGAAQLLVAGADFRDPVQGRIPDCSLIAAMSALAWVDPAGWRARLAAAQGAVNDPLTVTLFDNGSELRQQVSRRLPIAAGSVPFARSRTPTETWPTLIEKAAVKAAAGGGGDEPTVRDYKRFPRARPDEAATTLTGAAGDYSKVADVFDTVRDHCHPPVAVGGGARSSVARQPLMAWTYSANDGGYAAAEPNFGAATQLAANHAYTVLGWHRSGGETFVILRNPWGQPPSAPDPRLLQSPWPTGRPEPALDVIPMNQHGVIGVPKDLFNKCFDGIAWTDLPA